MKDTSVKRIIASNCLLNIGMLPNCLFFDRSSK